MKIRLLGLLFAVLCGAGFATAQISTFGIYTGRNGTGDYVYVQITSNTRGLIYVLSSFDRYVDSANFSVFNGRFSFATSAGRVGSGMIAGLNVEGIFSGRSFALTRADFAGPARNFAGEFSGTLTNTSLSVNITAILEILPSGSALLIMSFPTGGYDAAVGTIDSGGRLLMTTPTQSVITGTIAGGVQIQRGAFTIVATSGAAQFDYLLFPAKTSSFSNISTRGRVGTGDDILIAGFIVQDAPKLVYVRCLGPSLAALGVPGALSDPTIQLFSGQTVLSQNDDWESSANPFDMRATGSPPLHPKDAGLLVRLEPGAYTVTVSGVGNATGVALIEVNEVR